MRLRSFILFSVFATCAMAQMQVPTDTTGASPAPVSIAPNPLVTLASEFFEHDYVNVFGYVGGLVDTNAAVIGGSGQGTSVGTGFDVGGGINLFHGFQSSALSLSYSGGYNWYQSNGYNSGTTQNLALSFSKRISRRVSMNVGVSGGILLYGTTAFASAETANGAIISNPFSPETRFASVGLGFNFIQTRRLSYSVFGSFFLTRYNYPGSIGTDSASGGVSVNYRLTARTSISGVYSHGYFTYQRGAGSDSVDQVGVNLNHTFSNHWNASVYAGVGRSEATGTIAVPVTLLVGNQAVGGFLIGRYNQTSNFPSFSVSVSHNIRRSVFAISAGEGFAGSGNGYFLASKNYYINGIFSYSVFKQNISMGGSFYRLSSVANTVRAAYDGAAFSASWGHGLVRYVGCFLRYDYIHYGPLLPFAGASDNRFSFGLNFSSRSIPLTLF